MATTRKSSTRKAAPVKAAAKNLAKAEVVKIDAKILARVAATRKAHLEAAAAHDLAVVAAREAGATVTAIAKAAGVTPQVIRNTLKRAAKRK
jgi:hypothetical protein